MLAILLWNTVANIGCAKSVYENIVVGKNDTLQKNGTANKSSPDWWVTAYTVLGAEDLARLLTPLSLPDETAVMHSGVGVWVGCHWRQSSSWSKMQQSEFCLTCAGKNMQDISLLSCTDYQFVSGLNSSVGYDLESIKTLLLLYEPAWPLRTSNRGVLGVLRQVEVRRKPLEKAISAVGPGLLWRLFRSPALEKAISVMVPGRWKSFHWEIRVGSLLLAFRWTLKNRIAEICF